MVLHRHVPGPAVSLLQVEGFREFPGMHRGGAQVTHLARLHQVTEGFQGLLQRCRMVVSVHLVEIDVVGTESAQ